MNTILFGQKAKTIKTTVNINEVVKNKDLIALWKALSENEALKDKLNQLELMIKETPQELEDSCHFNTVAALKEQIDFL